MLVKKIISFFNNIYLLKNINLALSLSRGSYNWKPLRKLNFKIINNRVVSNDKNSSFSIKWFNKFNFSIINITNALSRYIITEENNEIYFIPLIRPELKFHLQRFDNINAANEILYEGLYNICTQDPLVVIDVGANVGISISFFSTLNFVKKVYAFEPFYLTYCKADQNIKLNNLKNVIIYNVGLSNKTKNIEVPDVEEGFMGASTTEFFLEEQRKLITLPTNTTTIKLLKASNALEDIIEENKEVSYLLKLDCEGAEYEIVEDLSLNDLLHKFKIIIIEWHFKGPQILLNLLKESGFQTLECSRNVGSPMGMIYAFK
jgi:FkbM family methyltransferase